MHMYPFPTSPIRRQSYANYYNTNTFTSHNSMLGWKKGDWLFFHIQNVDFFSIINFTM